MVKKYGVEILLTGLTVLVVFFALNREQPVQQDAPIPIEQEVIYIPTMAWGICIDSVEIDSTKVLRNQSLSDILLPKGISAYKIDRIARNSKGIFDVRRIKAGNNYYLIRKDTTGIPSFLIYEENITDYVIFDFDSLLVLKGQKQVDSLLQTTSGVIETSLWNAFVDNGASPVLAMELSDIFAWTVDFFGVQKGDEFRVIYDALYVEDTYAGIGKIHAATFTHIGNPISAYYFKNKQQVGYFDNEGNSLRKAFLKAPLRFSRISSRYSNSRFHPVLKIRRPHRGVDYAAPRGTPVYSIGDGTIVKKGYQRSGGGNYVNVKHNSVYTSQYMHLNGFASGIAPGVRVKQGQLIAYVGSTGLATGPHLDFRIYKNGTAVDPLRVDAPPVEPIAEENKAAFEILRDSLSIKLAEIGAINSEESLVTE